MSYTKGPWYVEPDSKYAKCDEHHHRHWTVRAYLDAERKKSFQLCELTGNRDEAEADARLIAAAPELLELVYELLPEEREVYEHILECDTPDEAEPYKQTLDRAEALLKRIKGESE